MDSNQIPRPDPDVFWRELDGEAVLFSARAGNVRVLNQMGTAIWHLLDGQRSIAEIRGYLTEHFKVSPAQADADLADFLRELEQRGLLQL